MKIVTYNGIESSDDVCRKINGQWYKIGDRYTKGSGQCYDIEGTYYRETSPKMAWDAELKKYNTIDLMVSGWTEEGELGYFTRRVTENYFAEDNLIVQNDAAITKNNLRYDYGKGLFNKNGSLKFAQPQIFMGTAKPSYTNLRNDVYNLSEYPVGLISIHFKEYPLKESIFDKFLHDQMFGLEIETDGGWLPENKYLKLGCVPLKDGSIKGTEITTLPYPANFKLMEDLFETCSKYTLATPNNSLHVNISGFSNTPMFRVAMYVLYYRIQQEIMAFIPLYKRSLEYLMNKTGGPKDHCKPLESLNIVHRYREDGLERAVNDADVAIFRFLNEGTYNNEYNIQTRKHVREGGHKWDQKNRYYALNMMPLYFGNAKNSRIEYRIHNGTVNKYKALNWIFICSCITKFVERNTHRILTSKEKITLDDILLETLSVGDTPEGNFLYSYLTEYIANKSAINARLVTKGSDDLYGEEFNKDNTYIFEIGKKSIFNFSEQQISNNIKSGKSSKKRS